MSPRIEAPFGSQRKKVLHLCRCDSHGARGKAGANLKKHQVSFKEAASAFADPLARIESDSIHDERDILLGQSEKGRLLFVVFVQQSEESIRLISARRATSPERRNYEESR